MSSFRVGELELHRGQRGRTSLPVGGLASGHDLALSLHVLHGALPGPTMLMVGVVHGEEIFAIDAIRSALAQVDLNSLRGTILAVPVANPLALAARTRNTPLDMLDLNRQFPGRADGWISERIAAALSPLVDRADCLLHIDGGTAASVIHYVFVNAAASASAAESLARSRAFGLRHLYRGPQERGSITNYAAQRGIPVVLAMIGGGPLYADPVFLRRASNGILNVLRASAMLDGDVEQVEGQATLTKRTLVRVPVGGILHPAIGLEAIDRELDGGALLGTVVDPFTLEEVASIQAPYARSVLLQLRVLPSAAQPGDYAFIIGDLDSAEVG